MSPEQQERIAQGIALVVQGTHSIRGAAKELHLEHTTLMRHLHRAAPILETAPERIANKALVATEAAIERMSEEMDVVDPKHLAAWAHTTARIAGLLDSDRGGSTASDMAELMQRLAVGGNTVTVGVRVEPSQQGQDSAAAGGGVTVNLTRLP